MASLALPWFAPPEILSLNAVPFKGGGPARFGSSGVISGKRNSRIPRDCEGYGCSDTPTGSPIRENAVFWSPVRIGQAQANHHFLAIENEPFSRCRTLPSPAPHWLHTKFAQRHGVKGWFYLPAQQSPKSQPKSPRYLWESRRSPKSLKQNHQGLLVYDTACHPHQRSFPLTFFKYRS